MNVVVMGVGYCGSFPTSTGLSYRELIQRAATMAYQDAGVSPEEVDGAVSVEEDFISGYSIADEYVPDQLGMVRKPVYTIPGDFLHGLSSAVMQLKTGEFKTVIVQTYSKASNILTKDEVLTFGYDPVFGRLGVSPHYLAGIEMQHFLDCSHYDAADVAEVVVRNKANAVGNPMAPYSGHMSVEDILMGRPVASPITEPMIARHADAAFCVVLGVGDDAIQRSGSPVLITGTGWGSGNSILERRDHAFSAGTAIAGKMALDEAGIDVPEDDVDLFYVSDLYAHRQLMHLDALGLPEKVFPYVNVDGGAQGSGDLFEATSAPRFYDAVKQLRGEAGAHQYADVETALVHGWRGLPTDSCAVVVLEGQGGAE